jgi:hypothetical protein
MALIDIKLERGGSELKLTQEMILACRAACAGRHNGKDWFK